MFVVTQTNLYAQQYFEKTGVLQQYSRAASWSPVTKKDIKIWVGFTLLTGLIDKKGDIAGYFVSG